MPSERERNKRFLKRRNQDDLRKLKELWHQVEPYWPILFILVVWSGLLFGLRSFGGDYKNIEQGIYAEAWGTLFDLILVVFVLGLFETMRNKKETIKRYIEEIDDFKRWDSDEARMRIAGIVRRLGKLGKHDIDFIGAKLNGFSFLQNDIRDISGSTFHSHAWTDFGKKTLLDGSEFRGINCSKVTFSRSIFDGAILGLTAENMQFSDSNLIDATFEGARLKWTNVVVDEYDWYDYDQEQTRIPIYKPAFGGANLMRTSFKYAELTSADFRDALNVELANFTETKGLESCFFDDGDREKIIEKFGPHLPLEGRE